MGGEHEAKTLAVHEGAGKLDANQRAALDKLSSLLTAGEQISASAFQLRLHALTHRRRVVLATDRRIIFFARGLFGGFDMQDAQWQDVKDARVTERIFPALFGADLFIGMHDGRQLSIVGAHSAEVRRIYAFAQQQEQAWREKNRIRKMEELRAQAGGVTIGGGSALLGDNAASGGMSGPDLMAQLKDAKALLDQGAISDAEYEALKAKLLAGMRA